MNLFDLVAKITLDTSEYEKGLDDSEKKADGFGSKLGSAVKATKSGITSCRGQELLLITSKWA